MALLAFLTILIAPSTEMRLQGKYVGLLLTSDALVVFGRGCNIKQVLTKSWHCQKGRGSDPCTRKRKFEISLDIVREKCSWRFDMLDPESECAGMYQKIDTQGTIKCYEINTFLAMGRECSISVIYFFTIQEVKLIWCFLLGCGQNLSGRGGCMSRATSSAVNSRQIQGQGQIQIQIQIQS